jgi:tetratricopeptide (TPR) repeat protein
MSRSLPRNPRHGKIQGESSKVALAMTPSRADTALSRAAREWTGFLVLAVAILVVYQRVWHEGFVWDDDAHLVNPGLCSLRGLWRIWSEPGATQQYYPVLYSAFWLEQRLWGYAALGYHLANVGLHLGVVLMLYRVLRRLSVPGAFFAALAFAVHPVCVESVAWVSEQKNTLSAAFYLAAALAYLRFDESRKPRWYALGLCLFLLALLSKTVTATLPAALLVVFWWRRGRLSWRADVAPLLPWFVMGAAAGTMTTWIERSFVGADGAALPMGPIGRLLVAGRSLWFYLAKDFWPNDLIFIYPRWAIDAHDPLQYLFPAAVLAVLAALFALRRISRGPLAAALLFSGTLFPALGFVDVYPFKYSFVADHFQYLALAMLLSAVAAALALAAAHLSAGARACAGAAAGVIFVALGVLTWMQSAIYADVGALWQATIARNPGCWMAYNNLGLALAADGQVDEAIVEYRKALEIEPGFGGARSNLGVALMDKGSTEAAIAEFRRALEIAPGDAEIHNNMGMALRRGGRLEEALAQYTQALDIRPDDFGANFNLGNALLQAGRVDEAITRYGRALEVSPDNVDAHINLGNAFRRTGRIDSALDEYRRALEIEPGNATARANLEAALPPPAR